MAVSGLTKAFVERSKAYGRLTSGNLLTSRRSSPVAKQPSSDVLDGYIFDTEAFGSVGMLAGSDDEGTIIDEHTVEEVLGLSTIIEGETPEDNKSTLLGDSEVPPAGSFAKDLALNTRFTLGEIEEKFAGFSGDVNRTHAFFVRCRSLVDDLYCAQMNEAVTSTSGRMMVRASVR